jgi:hypothetical protein
LRNVVLLKTPTGKSYIHLYYKHTLELSDIFAHHEELKEKAHMLIQSILPAVETLLAKKEAVIDEDMLQKSIAMIDALITQASPALEEDLSRLKKDIKTKAIFKTFTVNIQR